MKEEKEKNTILLVDDEEDVLAALSTLLGQDYNVVTATNVDEAIKKMDEHEVHLAIVDERMPRKPGIDLLGYIHEKFPDTVRIMLTAYANTKSVIDAINRGGVFRYIEKPWETNALRSAVRVGIERYNLNREIREKTVKLETARRELAESKEYMENIVRSMIDTLIVITPEGNIRTVNQATLDLLDYKEEELIGKPVDTIFAEEEEEEEEEIKSIRLKKLIKEGSVRDYDMKYRTKKGEVIPVSFSGSVVRDNEGKLVGIAGIARDMREIKRLIEKEKEVAAVEKQRADKLERTEQALRKAYEDLKEMHRELIRSEKLSAIGELAAGIAHEIRNPLSNIHASAQYSISKFELNQQLREYLNVMLRNSQRANKIIKDLLDFAKPKETSYKVGHIGDVIDNACHLVKTRCSRQHVRLSCKCLRKLPQIMIDEKRLEQVFLNFIINALDAMPDGGKLAITASLDSPKNDIVVRFSDTGQGIPQENLNKIFDPFFTTKEDGVGLGLSLAYRVIDYHKGKMDIESKVGKGTQVTVRLPMDFESQ